MLRQYHHQLRVSYASGDVNTQVGVGDGTQHYADYHQQRWVCVQGKAMCCFPSCIILSFPLHFCVRDYYSQVQP